jgi:glycosyltransferase involved in cell wall biosynthesis
MKILYIVHQFYPESSSGTERFLLNLASAMQRRGHHADIVTYSFDHKSSFRTAGGLLVKEYMYKGISVTAIRHDRVPIDINTNTGDSAILAFADDLLVRSGYDLLHIVHPMRLTSFCAAARKLGIPYLLTATDFWTICPKIILRTSFETLCTGPEEGNICAQLCPELNQGRLKLRLEILREVLDGAKVVISPSDFAARMVQKEFKHLQVSIVPHGLKLSEMKSNSKTYDHESKVIFAYCGGLAQHKGVHLLLSAFRSMKVENAEMHIYGAASPSDKDYARLLRNIADQDERIRFCGAYKEEDVGSVLQAIDVLVIPSLSYETHSFTLHEALACHVPVITSAIGVLDEKVKEGSIGAKFAFGNECDLTSKMKFFAENPQVLNFLKTNLKKIVVPLVEEEAYLYERIYHAALTNAKSPFVQSGGLD